MSDMNRTLVEDTVLDAEIEGDLMILRFRGAFDAAAFRSLAVSFFEERYRLPGKRWRVLMDLSGGSARGVRMVSMAAKAARDNRPFEEKVAFIGIGRGVTRFIFERFVALSGRTGGRDFGVFETEVEAMAWLSVGGVSGGGGEDEGFGE